MMRTALSLPETLLQRLRIASRQEGKSLSELARELLDKALTSREKRRNRHMYTTLKELNGIGEKEITDASITIDETLYGEAGAWRGRAE